MAFDLQAGFGAGAGADMLQQILRQKAQEAFQNQSLALAQQRQQQEAELQKAQLASIQADRQAKEQQMADTRSMQAASLLDPGTSTLQPNDPITRILQGGVAGATLRPDQTLSATNISGPVGGPLTATANPGQATGALRFMGTPQQLRDQQSEAALDALAAQHPDVGAALRIIPDADKRAAAVADYVKGLQTPTKTEGVFRQNPASGSVERLVNGQWTPWSGDTPPGSHWMTEPQAKTGNYSFQTMTGPDQMPMLFRGNAMTGDLQAVPLPQGVTAGRPSAAVQMKTEDRKRASAGLDQLDQAITNASSMIGPGAGRVSSIEQMIGNPDPRVQALGTKMLMTKMQVDAGIGGARAAASPQLLQRWDNLFSQKLTPEALHATVQAMREMLNEGQTTAPSGPKPSADDLIKKYGG